MERSIFFFLKNHISAPGERNCPNFFFYGSFPIILSCYKWVLSRLGPLHGQNWRNVSKKCLFGCPKPKSRKMTNLYPYSTAKFYKRKLSFEIFPSIFSIFMLMEKSEKYHFLLQVACGIGVKVNFPKTWFLTIWRFH